MTAEAHAVLDTSQVTDPICVGGFQRSRYFVLLTLSSNFWSATIYPILLALPLLVLDMPTTAADVLCAAAGMTAFGGLTTLVMTAIQTGTGSIFVGAGLWMTLLALISVVCSVLLRKVYPLTNTVN